MNWPKIDLENYFFTNLLKKDSFKFENLSNEKSRI